MLRRSQWLDIPTLCAAIWGTMCLCAAIWGPWGQNPGPKFSSLGGLKTSPTKTSNTTPHYYPKYEVSSKEQSCEPIPLSVFYKWSLFFWNLTFWWLGHVSSSLMNYLKGHKSRGSLFLWQSDGHRKVQSCLSTLSWTADKQGYVPRNMLRHIVFGEGREQSVC